MSVHLLSSLDSPAPDSRTQEPAAPVEKTEAAREGGGFERALETAWSQAEAQQSEPVKKSLDDSIRDGIDKFESAQADAEAWEKSREARAELDSRYRGFNGDTGKTLDLFLQMADSLKADPLGSAQEIARAYLKASRYNLDTTPAKTEKADLPIDPKTGRPYSGQVLGRVIVDAMESATAERQTFEATAKQRARLKELWPNLSFDQAMERIRQVDRNLHTRDPQKPERTKNAG
jgi:hypothetical protein